MSNHTRSAASVAALLCLLPAAAFAHHEGGPFGSLQSGLLHPIFGLDHLVAMLAVGIWGAQIGDRAMWKLAAVFPLVMAVGLPIGAAGLPVPLVEIAIALSVLGLGAAIAFSWKPPVWIGMAAVGLFAVFHGHAHGAELAGAANPGAYGIGLIFTTGLIHLAGIGAGVLARDRYRGRIAHACGSAMSLVGVYFLIG